MRILVFSFLLSAAPVLGVSDPRTIEKCFKVASRLGGSHLQEAVPTEVSQVKTGNPKTAPVFTELTSENIAKMFSHQYAPSTKPELRGAKGIVYRGLDGQLKVLMWATGEGPIGNSIHHRDAVASVLQQESSVLEKLFETRETIGMLNLQDKLERAARELSQIRSASTITDGIAERFSGFQMTASVDPRTGQLRLESVDLDSSLTSAQVSRGINQTTLHTQEVFDAISRVISSDVRPAEYRIDHLQIRGLSGTEPLRAPAGSRLGRLP